MNERLEAVVSGRVQLVMYRDFAARKARGLGLVGEVKNLSNGTVFVIAEGPKGALDTFIKKLHEGSILSHVENVEVYKKPATGRYQNFKITYE